MRRFLSFLQFSRSFKISLRISIFFFSIFFLSCLFDYLFCPPFSSLLKKTFQYTPDYCLSFYRPDFSIKSCHSTQSMYSYIIVRRFFISEILVRRSLKLSHPSLNSSLLDINKISWYPLRRYKPLLIIYPFSIS